MSWLGCTGAATEGAWSSCSIRGQNTAQECAATRVSGLTADIGPGPLDGVCQTLVHQQSTHEVELSILDVCHKGLAFQPEPVSLQVVLVSGSTGGYKTVGKELSGCCSRDRTRLL